MAVKIRLARRGRKKLALYDVVVADVRAPRDGRYIEKLGTYNPNTNPATIDIDEDKALDWMLKGAQPTDTARAILSYRGILLKKHLQIGVQKGAITQEEADKRFEEWQKAKEGRISTKVDSITKKREADKQARLKAESKVKEARTEIILKKQKALEEKAVKAAREAAGDEEEEAVAEEAAEAPVEGKVEVKDEAEVKEEPKAEEAPAEEKPV
ncbi:30S ribosomal protein S16, partial [Bacteroidota bacterium]